MGRKSQAAEDDDYQPTKKAMPKAKLTPKPRGRPVATKFGSQLAKFAPKPLPIPKSAPEDPVSPEINGSSAQILGSPTPPLPRQLKRPTKKPVLPSSPDIDENDIWDKDLRPDNESPAGKKGAKGSKKKCAPKKSAFKELELTSDATNNENPPPPKKKGLVGGMHADAAKRTAALKPRAPKTAPAPKKPTLLPKKPAPSVHRLQGSEDNVESDEDVVQKPIILSKKPALPSLQKQGSEDNKASYEEAGETAPKKSNMPLRKSLSIVRQKQYSEEHRERHVVEETLPTDSRDMALLDTQEIISTIKPTATGKSDGGDNEKVDVIEDAFAKRPFGFSVADTIENAGGLPEQNAIRPKKVTERTGLEATTAEASFGPSHRAPAKSPTQVSLWQNRLDDVDISTLVDDRAARKPNLIHWGKNGPQNQGVSPQKKLRRVPSARVNELGSPMMGNGDHKNPAREVFDLTQHPTSPINYTSDVNNQDYDEGENMPGSVLTGDEMDMVPTGADVQTRIEKHPPVAAATNSKRPSVADVPTRQPASCRNTISGAGGRFLEPIAQQALSSPIKVLPDLQKTSSFTERLKSVRTTDSVSSRGENLPSKVFVKRNSPFQDLPPAKRSKVSGGNSQATYSGDGFQLEDVFIDGHDRKKGYVASSPMRPQKVDRSQQAQNPISNSPNKGPPRIEKVQRVRVSTSISPIKKEIPAQRTIKTSQSIHTDSNRKMEASDGKFEVTQPVQRSGVSEQQFKKPQIPLRRASESDEARANKFNGPTQRSQKPQQTVKAMKTADNRAAEVDMDVTLVEADLDEYDEYDSDYSEDEEEESFSGEEWHKDESSQALIDGEVVMDADEGESEPNIRSGLPAHHQPLHDVLHELADVSLLLWHLASSLTIHLEYGISIRCDGRES
jgi:hypothetical protein